MAHNVHVEAVNSCAIVAGGPTAETVSDGEAAEAEEVKIAVMGVTGSGKSTFIRTMTGDLDICVGHTLQSATSEVGFFRFTHGSTRFLLIDTPGFDSASCTNEEIMTRVQKRLESSFRTNAHLNGLIYMHRIIDPKVQGSARSSMHMFRKLCGPDFFQNIVLATTFWEHVSTDEGTERERQLKENGDFWGALVKMGSQVVRLGKDRESGLKVLMEIAKKSKNTRSGRHEMVKRNNSAPEITATQAIDAKIPWQMQESERKYEEERLEIERQLERMTMETQQALEEERKRVAEEVRKRAELAAQQMAERDAAWEAEHERKWEELQEEREQAAMEMKKRDEAVKKRREALVARLREEEKLRTEQRRYYTCEKPRTRKLRCNACRRVIKEGHYWRCRRCQSGNGYYECAACGRGKRRSCGVRDHPYMKKRFQEGDSCAFM